MRRTKLSELSSRRVRRLAKFVWMSLDRSTRSIRLSPGQTSIFTFDKLN